MFCWPQCISAHTLGDEGGVYFPLQILESCREKEENDFSNCNPQLVDRSSQLETWALGLGARNVPRLSFSGTFVNTLLITL